MMIKKKMRKSIIFPSAKTLENLAVKDPDELRKLARQDLAKFWGDIARKDFEWFKPWAKTLDDSNKPFYKWFTGGQVNIVHNALDRHLNSATADKVALYFEGEGGDSQSYTYLELSREVEAFSAVLLSLGVKKGDCVTIYMGRIPQLLMAMLACAKIGALHSVVYGGFSHEALHGRLLDSQSKLLITCDGAFLRGKTIELKSIVDQALERESKVETVLCFKRTGSQVTMKKGRDFWFDELRAGLGGPIRVKTEVMDAEDPLFILYTSGTTGKPKAILHTHGGYMVSVATSLRWVFDLKDSDVWWCAADPGWITGHSYIVYGPLLLGATSLMYEGAPAHPRPDRWWELVAKYKVSILYTAPTAIRSLMKFGDEWPSQHDLSSLRLLGSVGEPINPEAWHWFFDKIGGGRCPIMDTWWQTETGSFVICPFPSMGLKPGSATLALPGFDLDVVNEDGETVAANEEGLLVIKTPWPSMMRTLWGDPDRYVEQYWSRFADRGWYLPGDSGRRDQDGYFWIIGRIDDVIKVSGYRLGTAEIESALGSHSAVAESAVIGLPDEIKGQVIHAFVILKNGYSPTTHLAADLSQHVGSEMGPIAKPSKVEFVEQLPKTRSGKIMRRLLRAQALGQPVGDTSTLE